MNAERSPLVAFCEGTGTDGAGRTLAAVQSLSLEQLEREHDYIQWLFPLRERSTFNPAAPVLDDAAITAFRSRVDLQNAVARSFDVMMRFYGFGQESRDGA